METGGLEEELKLLYKNLGSNFLSDKKWIRENYWSLVEKYDEQWIVVDNKKVIFNHKDRSKVIEYIKNLSASNPIPFEFISSRIY